MKQALSVLALVISMNCFGQPKPKNDTVYMIKFELPLVEWNKSVDSISRFAIPSIGTRMYTDEQKTYQEILIRQFNKYIQYSKLDTLIIKK